MKTKQAKSANGTTHLVLSEGSVSVKIYTSKQEKQGTTYVIHCVDYFEAGKRIRKYFSKLDEAKAWGSTVLTRLINGGTAAKGVSPVDLQDMALAKLELAGINVNLSTIAKEYRQATEQLKGKATINDAVRFFMAKANPDLPKKAVGEVSKEMIAAKTNDGLSARYLSDLRHRTAKFASAFPGEIAKITTSEIEKWLRGLGTGSTNRNNYANAVTTLFNFAKRAGYLSPQVETVAENLSHAKELDGEIEIYTPGELASMLNRLRDVKPELLPFVAIGAFAGIRTAEIARLNWEDVDFEQGLIEIGAGKAKTAQRRHVPIQPNLAKWLEPYRNERGLILKLPKTQLAVRRVVEPDLDDATGKPEKGVKWKPNALRHSYGSYRLPILKNLNELALEMGNSPSMIMRHYRELVKPAEALKFWAIEPPASAKAAHAA